MPSVYDLKPRFQALLRPIVKGLAKNGVTANQVTIAALLLSVIVGVLLVLFPQSVTVLWLVPVVLFVRMALNAIDGMLAREHDQKSALGGLLNEVGDVVSDVALYLPFAWLNGMPETLVIIVIAVMLITEVAGLATIQVGASRRYDGPMGKSDRAAVFGLIAILLALNISVSAWVDYFWMAIIVLLCLTVVNRMKLGLAELRT
ncbi:MAG: CDP-alcohol phosphatidyltransferase family protein [Methylococcales bacterium]|nr:CDP-alcohol phosphatidyltransferase family protein [Methylococcales bacterium]MBT7443918.1 CDP-alcohol phosphatidyltransferase family protein [Methylococcales bacterium]